MLKLKKNKILSLLSLSLFVTSVQAVSELTLHSFGLPLVQQATFIKPVEPEKQIHLVIWLKIRNKAKLDQLSNALYDWHSPHYQKFLTPGQYDQSYAPSTQAKQSVLAYFRAKRMTARLINDRIEVTATAQRIEKIFKLKLNYYRYQNRIGYANDVAPKLTADVAQHILQVDGLNDIARYHPGKNQRLSPSLLSNFKPQPLRLAWSSFVPYALPTDTSFAGFTGKLLRTTYNVASINPIQGTTINGAGQTLIIVDACGTNSAQQIMNDGNLYNSANGLTQFSASNFTVINPDGTPFTTCTNPDASSWDNEIALDVEASHTIAPGANTVLVLSQSDANPLNTAVDDVINTLINNNYTIAGFPNAYVISNSWGISESGGSSPGFETSLQKGAVHGISLNFSTGDCGDGSYTSTWPCTSGSSPVVEFPASSAYVTAVGGTSLFVDSNWNYAFEALWGSALDSGFYAGTTGGISQFYGPVAWQSSISSFTAGGYNSGTVGSYNKRALPDVSMLADPYTGLTIYEGGTSFVYGGTSLACPLFSGTLTLLNQARLLRNGTASPIGQAAPYFYINNVLLLRNEGLRLVVPPHQIIEGARPPPSGAPLSAFKIHNRFYHYDLTFGWDSSLTIAPENQFWNDGVGVGSINIPNFIAIMALL